jgi:hypothetical protein
MNAARATGSSTTIAKNSAALTCSVTGLPHDGDLAGGAGFLSVIFRFGADDGARAIGATDDAAAVELRGRRRRQP